MLFIIKLVAVRSQACIPFLFYSRFSSFKQQTCKGALKPKFSCGCWNCWEHNHFIKRLQRNHFKSLLHYIRKRINIFFTCQFLQAKSKDQLIANIRGKLVSSVILLSLFIYRTFGGYFSSGGGRREDSTPSLHFRNYTSQEHQMLHTFVNVTVFSMTS